MECVDTAKEGNDETRGIAELKENNKQNKGNNRNPKYTAWTQMDYKIIIKKF